MERVQISQPGRKTRLHRHPAKPFDAGNGAPRHPQHWRLLRHGVRRRFGILERNSERGTLGWCD